MERLLGQLERRLPLLEGWLEQGREAQLLVDRPMSLTSDRCEGLNGWDEGSRLSEFDLERDWRSGLCWLESEDWRFERDLPLCLRMEA